MVIKTGIIPRVAISIGGIEIYWYAIIITTAILIGYIWARVKNGRYGIKYDDVFNLSFFMIPIAVICARLYYVAFNLDYYTSNPGEIFNYRNGGIAIYGALIGAIATIIVFCKVKKIKVLDILDYLAPIIPLCQALGRWGNYVNVEAYGTETNGPIKMEIIEDGITKYVHPTFLYESIGNFIVFLVLLKVSKNRKFSGQIACLYLTLYAFVRFFVEGLRTDSLMLGPFRISQVLSLVIFIVGVTILVVKKIKQSQKKFLPKNEE